LAVSCSSWLIVLPARRNVIEVGLSQVIRVVGGRAPSRPNVVKIVLLEGGDRIDR
jgi:hypothetical protein